MEQKTQPIPIKTDKKSILKRTSGAITPDAKELCTKKHSGDDGEYSSEEDTAQRQQRRRHPQQQAVTASVAELKVAQPPLLSSSPPTSTVNAAMGDEPELYTKGDGDAFGSVDPLGSSTGVGIEGNMPSDRAWQRAESIAPVDVTTELTNSQNEMLTRMRKKEPEEEMAKWFEDESTEQLESMSSVRRDDKDGYNKNDEVFGQPFQVLSGAKASNSVAGVVNEDASVLEARIHTPAKILIRDFAYHITDPRFHGERPTSVAIKPSVTDPAFFEPTTTLDTITPTNVIEEEEAEEEEEEEEEEDDDDEELEDVVLAAFHSQREFSTPEIREVQRDEYTGPARAISTFCAQEPSSMEFRAGEECWVHCQVRDGLLLVSKGGQDVLVEESYLEFTSTDP